MNRQETSINNYKSEQNQHKSISIDTESI